MPFTFAHPAAVIPLHRILRQRAVLSAMVIGSMAPDFQNFLPFDVARSESHSLAGMFWFCLPVGMTLYLVFHLFLKKPLCELLPQPVAARLAQPARAPLLPPASGPAIVLSLLLGILTHLAWDALTHYGYLTVFVLPMLSAHVMSIGSYHVYPYKLLQHASTLAGTLLLWHWAKCWLRQMPMPRHAPPPTLARHERHIIAAILLLAPPLAGVALAAHSLAVSYGVMELKDIVREAVVTAISGFGLLLLAYGVVWHGFLWQRHRPDSRLQ